MWTSDTDAGAIEQVLGRHQKSPQEVARLGDGVPPFSYEDWKKEAPPASAEELADWEEFLRFRQAEREASLAAEAGFGPGP